MQGFISRQAAIDALDVGAEVLRRVLDEADVVGVERAKYEWGLGLIESHIADVNDLPSAQLEQRWIPCGKCIHADGKHRWCKVLDRTINEDYFCYWAEPFRREGESDG